MVPESDGVATDSSGGKSGKSLTLLTYNVMQLLNVAEPEQAKKIAQVVLRRRPLPDIWCFCEMFHEGSRQAVLEILEADGHYR